jgi:hypothetical protein
MRRCPRKISVVDVRAGLKASAERAESPKLDADRAVSQLCLESLELLLGQICWEDERDVLRVVTIQGDRERRFALVPGDPAGVVLGLPDKSPLVAPRGDQDIRSTVGGTRSYGVGMLDEDEVVDEPLELLRVECSDAQL